MSKTYRCRVQNEFTISVDSEDQLVFRLRVNDTLEEQETTEILRQKLAARGGEARDDGAVVLEVQGVELRVDPATRVATARLGEKVELAREVDQEVDVYNVRDSRSGAQRQAETRVAQQVMNELREAKDRMEQQVRERLEQAAGEMVQTLREVTVETEKEAVLRKAERMGQVLGVTEGVDAGTGVHRLVIELKLPD